MVTYFRNLWRWVGLMLWVGGWAFGAGACTQARALPAATATPLPPTATLMPSSTPSPTISPSPTLTPSPTTPCLDARVQGPAEIEDQVLVGTTHTYTWQVVNTGACSWEPPFTLVALADSEWPDFALDRTSTVAPGETLPVTLDVTAPAEPGEVVGRWTLRTAAEDLIPVTLSLRLRVIPPTPTPTATPGPPVFVQRQVDVTPGKVINFDDGYADVAYNYNGPEDQGLGHTGVVFFVPIYFWPPDFADCYHAPYTSKNAILNPQYQVGQAFCYITNEKRVGALRIDGYYVDPTGTPHLVLTYITWAAERK